LIPGIGREVGGARRWFRFRFISFQPSELAGLVMVFYLADFIARKQSMMKSFMQGFVPPLCILGVCSGLILLEPDLGTTMSIGMVVFLMLYVSGVRFRYLVSTVLAALPALYLLVFTVPYRRMRIMAFLNPWLDPRGSGFQIIQSQIALGSGGLFGVGLGHSKQKLFYLPAAHTDFIFSIIGEELGLMGTFGIVLLFMLLIYHGVKIVRNSRDRFDFFLAFGIVLMITLKAVINIGVSCGVFPTKGLPLPFISYGGSSLVMDMVSIGLLLNIAKTQEYA
ncbi:MAG: putative lipid II flippase FtsW, partial [Candidatus Omnitrophica bacterium]|nr:putative lipid II flippase FtsW [Candidatus Omnitrophota bacterium]